LDGARVVAVRQFSPRDRFTALPDASEAFAVDVNGAGRYVLILTADDHQEERREIEVSSSILDIGEVRLTPASGAALLRVPDSMFSGAMPSRVVVYRRVPYGLAAVADLDARPTDPEVLLTGLPTDAPVSLLVRCIRGDGLHLDTLVSVSSKPRWQLPTIRVEVPIGRSASCHVPITIRSASGLDLRGNRFEWIAKIREWPLDRYYQGEVSEAGTIVIPLFIGESLSGRLAIETESGELALTLHACEATVGTMEIR